MTNHEIEKLAQAYAGQHETRCKENQFHLAISFMELRAAFIAGYLKGIEKAIEICELYMNPNNKFVAEIFDVKEALEQLLSSEGGK